MSYFATVANSAYNLYLRNRAYLAQDLHNTMILISSIHAIALDIIDTAEFLNELWEENTAPIDEFCQSYTTPAVSMIEGIIAYLLADRTTVKQLSNEVLEEIDQDRQEFTAQAKILTATVTAFIQTYIITPANAVITLVETSLESLKAQAKELKIKGWNFYRDAAKLQARIEEVMMG